MRQGKIEIEFPLNILNGSQICPLPQGHARWIHSGQTEEEKHQQHNSQQNQESITYALEYKGNQCPEFKCLRALMPGSANPGISSSGQHGSGFRQIARGPATRDLGILHRNERDVFLLNGHKIVGIGQVIAKQQPADIAHGQ